MLVRPLAHRGSTVIPVDEGLAIEQTHPREHVHRPVPPWLTRIGIQHAANRGRTAPIAHVGIPPVNNCSD